MAVPGMPPAETGADAGLGAVPQFYIPATASLQERRPRTLKHGDSFAVFDPNGDIVPGPGSPEGIFHADTRYLSQLALTLSGHRPMLLSSTLRTDNATLTCDLTNPDMFVEGRLALEKNVIHVRRTRFLWESTCFERLGVHNHSASRQRVRLELSFAADYADLFEVRGSRRARRGRLREPEIREDGIVLGYTGLDGILRTTSIRFDPAPASLSGNTAVFDLVLPPQAGCSIHVEIGMSTTAGTERPGRRFRQAIRQARHSLRHGSRHMATVETSNDIFNEVVCRSVADLRMLVTDTPEGPVPYAGIPWYSTVFGRDALITAFEILWMDPGLARGVLRHLASLQATAEDPAADAEPGKILHEVRHGEMAALGEVPFRRYYGSIDSTPLFVILAGAYLQRTGDLETVRELWPNVLAALLWMDRYGDRDGDGFLEYGRRNSRGLANQGWKDSHDSIFHADGRLATGPIATVEVQAYAYAARRAGAAIARALHLHGQAVSLEVQAEQLRQRFEESFWDEALGTYVLALDGDKQPCRVPSSNAGHALFAGIAAPDRAQRVAANLLGSDMYSGWGIRTVATGARRYNPMSYHNGSVWPHDNAMIAMGFARYGLKREVLRLFDGLFSAAAHADLRRLPELFCGFARRPGRGPTLYPVACTPQAWAAVAPLALLQACLSLDFEVREQEVRFERPALPAWLSDVTLRNLALGGHRADVQIRRHGTGDVAVRVLSRTGPLRVVSVS